MLTVRPVGATAVLAEVEDAGQALALALWLRDRVEAVEVVPAARTVLVDGCQPLAVQAALARWTPTREVPEGPLVEVPVTYGGPDLASTADLLGLTPDQLVESHAGVDHVVAFCGFAPGFGYLAGSPWEVPRLDSPRPRVEAGAVGLAGTWTGIYPSASPGGWRLIGRTEITLWDPSGNPPALLEPGTRVRFVAR